MDKTKEIISISENKSKMERKVACMKDKKDKYEKAGESLEAAGKGMMGCGCTIIIGIILIIFVFLPMLMMF